jgi:NAD(P)-dependent dehydrogenase (short-subunit alcohol dehydrogenase family)
MAINYLGHFLLTHLLTPQLIAGSENNDGHNTRVVNVSSCAHECGTINYEDFNYQNFYHTGLAYGDSKLAQIMFTRHMEKVCREKSWKIQSHAGHPGVVDTEIFQNSIWGSMKWLRQLIFKVN